MSRRLFEPVALETSLPTPLLPTAGFRSAFVAAVGGGVAISAIQALWRFSLAQRAAYLGLASFMIVLALAFRRRDRPAVAAYLFAQIAAATAMTVASRSDSELSLLAVLAQAVLCMPRWFSVGLGAWAVGASTIGSMQHGVTLWQALTLSLTAAAGAAFVVAFTELALREWEARTEATRLVAELAEANAQLRELGAHLEELAVERERSRIARDVHDILGHSLTAAHAQLTGALAVQPTEPARATRMVETARDLIASGLDDVRASVAAIRGGLARPLLEELSRLFASLDDLTHEIRVEGEPLDLPPRVGVAALRCVQECVTNSLRHARASRVALSVRFDDDALCLEFEDDGVGMASAVRGTGLRGLEERLAELGGSVALTPRDGSGLRVKMTLPLR